VTDYRDSVALSELKVYLLQGFDNNVIPFPARKLAAHTADKMVSQ